MGTSSSKKGQCHFPSAFESLPFEIREQIWLETLVPRLIYLHPHRRIAPHEYDHERDEILDSPRPTVAVRFNHSLYTASATPAQAFADYASFAVPNPPKNDRMDGESLEYDQILAKQPLAYKSADPPAALYVCRESRALALRRGYVLSFKGVDRRLEQEDKEYWQKNNLGDKGVWVDFEHDIIMLDALYRPWMYSKCASLEPLVLLHKFAPAEVKSLKRLALGGNSSGVLQALRGQFRPAPYIHGQRPRPSLPRQWPFVMGFVKLEEIWIDDGLEQEGDGLECSISKKDTQALYLDALSTLSMGKSVLQVKVVRGGEWHTHF